MRRAGLHQVTTRRLGAAGGENPLTFTSGLTRTGDTVTNDLITGKAGGQTVLGGTGAGDNLTLQSTSNATRGNVVFADPGLFSGAGTAAAPAVALVTAGTTGWYHDLVNVSMALSYGGAQAILFNPNRIWMLGNTAQLILSNTGDCTFARNNAIASLDITSGGKFRFTPGVPAANRTASTEYVGSDFDQSRTVTWATGAIATQREFLVRAPTYAFAAASTITTAATLAITAAPIAGANATITNARALWVQAGLSELAGGTISPTVYGATTTLTNLSLQSTTHATRGAVVSQDAFGVGRVPGTGGNPPWFAVAGNVSTASGASATLDYVVFNSPTVTITGATNITTATGFNYFSIEPPTYSTTVTIGAGGTTPPAATLVIKGAPTVTGGGGFAGTAGAMGLWVQSSNVFVGGSVTATGTVSAAIVLVSGTSTQLTVNSVVLDPGSGGVSVAGTGAVGAKVLTLTNAGLTALSIDGIVKLLSETAANGTGSAVTLPNFGGTGRPVAGTPAGWWHVQQSGNDRYIPFWGP